MKKLSFERSLLFLFLTFAIFSCTNEDTALTTSEEGDSQNITIQIAIPGTRASVLRSMSDTEENTIRSIDVLVFRVGADGKEYYDYSARAQEASDNPNGTNQQSFNIIVRQKTDQQRVVVIANAGTQVADLMNSDDWKDKEKEEMLSKLEFSLAAGTQWDTSDNYTALPMWGESGKITVTSTTTSVGAPVSLLRMAAKMDVRLDTSVAGITDQFKLKSVHLYNTHTKGRIVPEASAILDGAVIAASIPSSAQIHYGPLFYSGDETFAAPGELDIAMRSAIYTFETAAPADNDRLKATGLVIGGLFQNDTKPSYYRVDFLNEDKSFRDILRNHLYEIKIVRVDGRGYDDFEEAWESKSANMEVEILEWDENGMGDIVFDDQYYLSVNVNDFLFFIDGCDEKDDHNTLDVRTDYPGGWKIESITSLTEGIVDAKTWLTITDANGNTNLDAHGDADFKSECVLTYTTNDTGKERKAQIVIAAGRLRYTVIVTQNTLEKATISFYEDNCITWGDLDPTRLISNDTLKIYHDNSQTYTSKCITVAWTPRDSDLVVYEKPLPPMGLLNMNVNPTLHYIQAGSTVQLTNNPGLMQYAITITNNEELINHAVAFVFIATNGVETTEKKLVIMYLAAP